MKFRFQDLEVWRFALEISDQLLDVADEIEGRKLYRFSEQLRGAAMSVCNNIAEGSGSNSRREFAYFLNIAGRSAFENANILIILNRRRLLTGPRLASLLEDLDKECRMITSLRRSL